MAVIIDLKCYRCPGYDALHGFTQDAKSCGATILASKLCEDELGAGMVTAKVEDVIKFQRLFAETSSAEHAVIVRADKTLPPKDEDPILRQLRTAVNLGQVRDNRSAKARWLRSRGIGTKEIARLLDSDYHTVYVSLRYSPKSEREQVA